VEYAPYQEAAEKFPDIPLADFKQAVQLVMPEGAVYQGAEAVFRALACAPGCGAGLWLYRRLPGFRPASEAAYRVVARHRAFFSRLTRLFWGASSAASSSLLTRWIFLRMLGVIYLVAFVSLGIQALGLYGQNGVLPIADFLGRVAERYGPERFYFLPSLFWLNASNAALQFVWIAGAALSVLLIAGVAPAAALIGTWVCYLSYLSVGQDFLSFQWDILLVETGFLAIFLAPLQIKPGLAREAPPSKTVVWLFRLLLFRLMFMSGAVKLLSGDPTWRSLTALLYHYQTQPLPTWIGWFAQQLPVWFQRISVFVMFSIELAVPFFLFAPRRLRNAACMVLIALQILILLTGNYCFFNWLAIALCLMAMDDGIFSKGNSAGFPGRPWPRWVIGTVAFVVMIDSAAVFMLRLDIAPAVARPLYRAISIVEPFRIANSYGLFAVMTTSRLEIEIEGSNDGVEWRPYEFKYKPGDLAARPGFVAPHQPRLDWQMWFAALGSYQQNPWFMQLCRRLLEGSPDVLALLKSNPFPAAPPKYLRAEQFDYYFTDIAEWRRSGHWWRREPRGSYCPVLSLKD